MDVLITIINNPNSSYSTPEGSLNIPNGSSSSVKYICTKTWIDFIKDNHEQISQDDKHLHEIHIHKVKKLIHSYLLNIYNDNMP